MKNYHHTLSASARLVSPSGSHGHENLFQKLGCLARQQNVSGLFSRLARVCLRFYTETFGRARQLVEINVGSAVDFCLQSGEKFVQEIEAIRREWLQRTHGRAAFEWSPRSWCVFMTGIAQGMVGLA